MSEENMKSKREERGVQGPKIGHGPSAMGMKVEKAKDFKGTAKALLAYLKPHKVMMFIVIFFAILGTSFAIVGPKMLGSVTNQIFEDYSKIAVQKIVMDNLPEGQKIPDETTLEQILAKLPPEKLEEISEERLDNIVDMDITAPQSIQFDIIWETVFLLIILYILSALFMYIQGWVMVGVSQKISHDLRTKIVGKMSKLPLKYFDTQTHGDVLSRMTNDIDTISQSLNQSMTQLISAVITIIGILGMMISISLSMTLVAILSLPASFIFIRKVIKKSQSIFSRQQKTLGEINGHIEEMYGAHVVVKAFNREDESLEKFNEINEKLYDSVWKSQFLSGLMFPIMSIIGNFGYVAIAVLGGWLAINGKVRLGDIQAFIQYMQQFTRPITQTANMSSVLQSTVAAAERVFEFLDEKEQTVDGSISLPPEKLKGEILFDSVNFSYVEGKKIIKNFDAKIKPGQLIALVGPTGAGKTTIVNLLMRFYDVTSGAILIDGININDIKREDLRRLFGMVLQDTWLFNGTIRENIAYNTPNVSDTHVELVAKAAYADHFIKSFPNGYDMLINEEADNISQGEKQLITIARAMLADSPMLILDEATSSVDTRTEQLIQKAMDKLMGGRTTFIIAHRLSTIKNADLILVMKDGNIIEQGKHQELLDQQGFYAELYESQFKK